MKKVLQDVQFLEKITQVHVTEYYPPLVLTSSQFNRNTVLHYQRLGAFQTAVISQENSS